MNMPSLSALTVAFDYVFRASLLGTIAIALVLLVRWTIGKRLAPAARSWLWLPVVLLCLGPQLPGLVDLGFSPKVLPQPVKEAVVPAADTTVIVRGEPVPLSAPPEPERVSPVPRLSLKEKMALCWGVGSFAILSFWLLAYVSLWQRIRRHQMTAGGRLAAEFRACVRLSGFRCAPRLIVSRAVESPSVAGLWRPVVLMPPHLTELLGEEALRHVLLHELAHLRRKDLWLHWVSALVVAMHWFNPFVWIASRKFRGDRESACDATVIGLGENQAQAHAYGQTLLALESRVVQPVALRLMAGILGGADLVRQRIVDITRFGKTSRRAAWIAFLAVLGGTAVIALAAAEPATPKVTPSKPEKATQAGSLTDQLYTRTFKVTPDFLTWTQNPGEVGTGNSFQPNTGKVTAIEVLKNLGIHFPEGASAAFIPATSQLIVRNSQANLDFIKAIVDAKMNNPIRQVYVRSHLVVFKEGASLPSIFAGPATLPEKPVSSETPVKAGEGPVVVQHPVALPEHVMTVAGVFTDPQFQVLLASLLGKGKSETKAPAEVLTFPLKDLSSTVEAVIGLPSVTTRSGHKATVEVAREFIYPTEFDREEPKKEGERARYTPKTFEMRPIGLVLEIDPVVGPDGHTIDLNLKPQLPAFGGWMDYPLDTGGTLRNPVLYTNTVTTAVTIWDGQTIAFGGQAYVPAFLMNPALKGEAALESKKHSVMIFVTATMINPSGNPVKQETPKGEKIITPEKEPASPTSDTKAGTSDVLSVSLGRLQFQVRKPDTGEIDGASMKAFVESQVAVLLGKEARTRAVTRVKTLHPELKPVAVDLGISRLPDTGQVTIQATGKNEAYVAHFLNCLLDETIALRKETVEKSLGGSLNKMLEDALTAQKNVQVAAVQYEQAVKSGAAKDVVNRLEEELERAKATHHLWMQRLGRAEGSTLVTGEAKILERPAFVEGNKGR